MWLNKGRSRSDRRRAKDRSTWSRGGWSHGCVSSNKRVRSIDSFLNALRGEDYGTRNRELARTSRALVLKSNRLNGLESEDVLAFFKTQSLAEILGLSQP